MADLPFLIQAANVQELVRKVQHLMDDLYHDRVAGAEIGDVFSVGSDNILTIALAAAGGLEKSSGELQIKVSPTGGLQTGSSGAAIKCKTGGGVTVDAGGLSASGAAVDNFKTINCPSGTNPVAAAAADTLNLAAGNGITVTGDSGTKTVTFAVKQQTHLADAVAVSGVTAGAGADSIDRGALNTSLGTLVTEINAIKTVLNNLIAKLESAEIIASS